MAAMEAPGIATTLKNNGDFLGAVKEEMFMFGYRPYMFLKALLSYVRPSAAFFSNITPEARATSAMRLRESTKFAAAMGLANLFNYYTDRPFAFIYGPLSLCFISSLSSSEAMYGAFGRLFGTLTGAIVGLFFTQYSHTIVQDVAILCTVNFIFSFFRTGRYYGNAAAYASVQLIPMVADKYTDRAAVARVTQITFGLLIYTFIAVMVLPTQPMVELTNARVAVLVKMAKTFEEDRSPLRRPVADRDHAAVHFGASTSTGAAADAETDNSPRDSTAVPNESVAAGNGKENKPLLGTPLPSSTTTDSRSSELESSYGSSSPSLPTSSPFAGSASTCTTAFAADSTSPIAWQGSEEVGLRRRRGGGRRQQQHPIVVKDDIGQPASLYDTSNGGRRRGDSLMGSGTDSDDSEGSSSRGRSPPPVPGTWAIAEPPMENGDFIPRVHKPRMSSEEAAARKAQKRRENMERESKKRREQNVHLWRNFDVSCNEYRHR